MTKKKCRLDVLLAERGLVASRSLAQSMILAGRVRAEGRLLDKAGALVPVDTELELIPPERSYVSRGGDKLAPALEFFRASVSGLITIDVGSSTGGFTDCLLQNGAALVYAVDVGRNQLDFSLRQDSRVRVMEETNARYLVAEQFEPLPSFATVDLSFISLRYVLPSLMSVLVRPAVIIALVKPQFELGREHISKGGIVRDEALQKKAVALVEDFAVEQSWESLGSFASPLKGAKKANQEYFICLKNSENL